MKLNSEPIRNWFGFTRRERSSAFVLMLLIVLILVVRYSFPENNTDLEDITALFTDQENSNRSLTNGESSAAKPFFFDPNTASYDTLTMVGLTSKEAGTLINYRNKGGKFRKPADINKIYGIEQSKADELIPFVRVKPGTTAQLSVIQGKQQKSLIELNSCDSALLETLPGIGPVLSVRIIKYRRLIGGFVNVNQLKEVYGLPLETFEHIKGRVYADSSAVSRISINSADYKELLRTPYMDRYEVSAILKYRELKGRLEEMCDLIENKLITEEKAAKVKPYLSFE